VSNFDSADMHCLPVVTPTMFELCVTAIHIPGNALRSFDISFVSPNRNEYYLADRRGQITS
jgi:hypothetical protein